MNYNIGVQKVQLHWQNRQNIEQTIFVAEEEFKLGESASLWAMDVISLRAGEMPEGWMPMLCTEDCRYFVKQPTLNSPPKMSG